MLVIPMMSSAKDFKEFMKTTLPEFKRQQNWSLMCQVFERADHKHPAVSSPAEHRPEAKADSSQPSASPAPSDRLFLVTSSDFTCSVLVQNDNVACVDPTDETSDVKGVVSRIFPGFARKKTVSLSGYTFTSGDTRIRFSTMQRTRNFIEIACKSLCIHGSEETETVFGDIIGKMSLFNDDFRKTKLKSSDLARQFDETANPLGPENVALQYVNKIISSSVV